jgi:hypothetical protein
MTQDTLKNTPAEDVVKDTPAGNLPSGTPSAAHQILFALSLVPTLGCVLMWLLILDHWNTHPSGGPNWFDLYPVFLFFGICAAHIVSVFFSLIGLCYVWFAGTRNGRAFGWLLVVNVVMVATPFLGAIAYNSYERSISLVRAVNSADTRRLEALLATRQRPPHPDEANLAMTAAIEAGNIEMVDMLIRAYREKWPRDTASVNTYENVLIFAAAKKNVDLVRTLLERGVDPNKCRFGFHNEKSLLDYEEREAKSTNDWRIVDLLRSHGAK